ncbi:MAG TPA: hypothetical protein VK745_16115 [Polyangiaceae bacterium]|nr:hypothetical protein [Polyangiaceae bacterium]
MTGRSRSFWLSAAALAYVCVGAAHLAGSPLPWLALLGLPAILAETWRRTAVPAGKDSVSESSRSALRAVVWGSLLWAAARTGPAGRPALDAAANLGAGTAAVAALVAIARIAPRGGLLTPPKAALSLDAATFAGFLWAVATAIPLGFALFPAERVRLDPLMIDYASTSAAVGSLLVFVAASFRLRSLRRLELGVGDRAAGALALAITTFSVAIPASLLDVAPPDRILPVAVWVAALAMTWAATTPEPTTVSSGLRGVLAILILGTPLILGAGAGVRAAADHAGAIVLTVSTLCIFVGLIARAVARPLGPEQSRWLDAIEAASRGALQPEPDSALCAALEALSKTATTPNARPAIFRNSPPEMLSVDIAGYLHVEAAEAPDRLYELAKEEPERTLRAEALQALAVRRPEVRPLITWFEDRRAFSATLVIDEDGPIGFILLPAGTRTTAMTLEEARAVRVLADRISALLAVSSALARSRERELKAAERADRVDDECKRLEHIIFAASGRHVELAERLARSVRTTAYSPAARQVLERLERLGRQGAPISLLAPPGVEAIGWAAHAHLESGRSKGAFVVVDGTNSAEHARETWLDSERSPLVLADGGTLTILDVAVLPLEIQDLIAQSFSGRATGPAVSSVAKPGLFVTLRVPLARLLEEQRLSRDLARWLGESEVALPGIAERAEDLQALALEALSRVGLSQRGEPLGIEPSALRLLAEHDWPGNELEFRARLLSAARRAPGSVVRAEDLLATGFAPADAEPFRVDLDLTPPPALLARRPRPRRMPRGR